MGRSSFCYNCVEHQGTEANEVTPWSGAAKKKRNSNRKFFTYSVVLGVIPLCAAAMSRPTSFVGCTIAIVDRIGTTQ